MGPLTNITVLDLPNKTAYLLLTLSLQNMNLPNNIFRNISMNHDFYHLR